VRRTTTLHMTAAVGISAAALAFGTAAGFGFAADHLDAPGLTSPNGRFDADINDVYAFQGSDPSRTVLAMTTHPAVGVFAGPDYATDVRYQLNVDRNGDALPDLAYTLTFGAPTGGHQSYVVRRYTGVNARTLAHGVELGRGTTGTPAALKGDGRVFAGLRSDPFFFDLGAFRKAVLGQDIPDRTGFCDQAGDPKGIDFFVALNTNAIVLELPDDAVGTHIGVWATTTDGSGRIDRMGRPAINTVFNKGEDKNRFNRGNPDSDFAGFSGNVEHTLEALGGYDATTATAIAHVLLPDMLTYDTSTPAAGPLNGRKPTDDVIDVELGLVTNGAIPSDCVPAHTDYLSAFPYLGNPH
jgi:hypothetical protein